MATIDKHDRDLIELIVSRAVGLPEGGRIDSLSLHMDLEALHSEKPLDLLVLLHSQELPFNHDIYGIKRHLDRETKSLEGFFIPHCGYRSAPPSTVTMDWNDLDVIRWTMNDTISWAIVISGGEPEGELFTNFKAARDKLSAALDAPATD